jgi:uncharacterized protein (TIGR04255 family)
VRYEIIGAATMNDDIFDNDKVPIVEALIDVRLVTSTPTDAKKLETLFDVNSALRIKEQVFAQQIKFGPVADTVKMETVSSSLGWAFKDNDVRPTRIFQARADGFTYNRVGKYPGWEEFAFEAKSCLAKFVGKVDEPLGMQISLRYINRLVFPGPRLEPKDVFSTMYVEVPANLPQDLFESQIRVTIPFFDSIAGLTRLATINQVFQPTLDEISVIFDITVTEYLPGLPLNIPATLDEVWLKMETLREIKNKIFWSSLNPTFIERYRKL